MGNHITVGKMSDDEGTLGNGQDNMADGTIGDVDEAGDGTVGYGTQYGDNVGN